MTAYSPVKCTGWPQGVSQVQNRTQIEHNTKHAHYTNVKHNLKVRYWSRKKMAHKVMMVDRYTCRLIDNCCLTPCQPRRSYQGDVMMVNVGTWNNDQKQEHVNFITTAERILTQTKIPTLDEVASPFYRYVHCKRRERERERERLRWRGSRVTEMERILIHGCNNQYCEAAKDLSNLALKINKSNSLENGTCFFNWFRLLSHTQMAMKTVLDYEGNLVHVFIESESQK